MELAKTEAQKSAVFAQADEIVAAAEKLLREAPKGEMWPQNIENTITRALAAVRRQALSLGEGATLVKVSANILGIVAYALGRLDVPLAFIERRIGEFGLTINTMVHVPAAPPNPRR